MQREKLAKWISVWFGVGLIPKAPGTFGSIAALPLAWLVSYYFTNIGLLVFSFVIFAVGCWSCSIYVKLCGREDPREAVIDEVAGQCFLLSAMPISWKSYLIALVLFRFFDIFKPYPVSLFDREVHGGVGVMLDDMIAAAYPIILVLVYCIVTHGDLMHVTAWLE